MLLWSCTASARAAHVSRLNGYSRQAVGFVQAHLQAELMHVLDHLRSESGAEAAVNETVDGTVDNQEEVRHVGDNVDPHCKRWKFVF